MSRAAVEAVMNRAEAAATIPEKVTPFRTFLPGGQRCTLPEGDLLRDSQNFRSAPVRPAFGMVPNARCRFRLRHQDKRPCRVLSAGDTGVNHWRPGAAAVTVQDVKRTSSLHHTWRQIVLHRTTTHV